MADPLPTNVSLAPFLAAVYPDIKARFPGEGRRMWRLRAAEAFWQLPAEEKARVSEFQAGQCATAATAEYTTDADPYDGVARGALAVLVRTDYADEPAWAAFVARLRAAEAAFAAPEPASAAAAAGPPAAQDQDQDTRGADDGSSSSSDDEDGADGAPQIIALLDAAPGERARFAGASNLAVLRLLADVDVRRAPARPAGTRRARAAHRLVDLDGLQEVYAGPPVWVYDARSGADGCARLVSLQGSSTYGTATADSWRARVGHIPELQANLSSGAMQIDFGGLDRYDHAERVRNMDAALQPLALSI